MSIGRNLAWLLCAVGLAATGCSGYSVEARPEPNVAAVETGTAWRLSGVVVDGVSEDISYFRPVFLLFDGGELRGDLGCNVVTGEYSVADGRIDFRYVVFSLVHCDREEYWPAHFGDAVPYVVDGKTLTFVSEETVYTYQLTDSGLPE